MIFLWHCAHPSGRSVCSRCMRAILLDVPFQLGNLSLVVLV